MRHAGAGTGEEVKLGRVQFDAMGVPDIRPDPAQVLRICAGALAIGREAIGDVLFVFGQMGVHHHALVPRQQRRIAHQLGADREGRTGGDADAAHGPFGGIVKGVDHADAIVQDRGLVLDQSVGGRPPLLSPMLIAPRVG